MAYPSTKLDVYLPLTKVYIDGQRMVWENDKRMRYQDFPLLENLPQSKPMWCHMTK